MSLAVHEFRSPGHRGVRLPPHAAAEQAGPLTDKQRKMLEEADRSCGRIGALVEEMSELGKLEAQTVALARQTFDLAELVSRSGRRQHEGEDRGVRLDVRGTGRPVPVAAATARACPPRSG